MEINTNAIYTPRQKWGKFRHASVLSLATGLAMLAFVSSSPTGATPLPVTHVSGTLTANTTWIAGNVYMVDSTLTIPSGITLTIDGGAIVKYASGYFNAGIKVASSGVLDVNGTNSDPVAFTSAEDDSLGGDSLGNGVTSGSLGDYGSAVKTAGGTVNISYGDFEYATTAIQTDGNYSDGDLAVSDSVFHHIDQMAIYHQNSSVSLQRNTFSLQDGTSSLALRLQYVSDLSGIALSGTDQNVFTGTRVGSKTLDASGTVPIGSTWNVSATSGAILSASGYTVAGTLDLPADVTHVNASITVQNGGTVNIPAGAIVKMHNYSTLTGVKVQTGGTLNVNGSSLSPAVFTSAEDDSHGGDTTGDGATSGTIGDYGNAVITDGGTVSIAYADIEYGGVGVMTGGNYSDGSLTVTDSAFSHTQYQAIYHMYGPLVLARNTFNAQDGSGPEVIHAWGVPDLTSVSLSGIDANSFTATRLGGRTINTSGTVLAASTWDVDASTGVVLQIAKYNVYGTLNLSDGLTYVNSTGSPTVTAYSGAVVTVPAGAVMKFANSASMVGFQTELGGALNVNGSSVSPVTFTSAEDDSIGGDMTNDGATSGSVGDYRTAIVTNGGTVAVSYVDFRYGDQEIATGGNYNDGSLTVADSTFNHISGQAVYHMYGPLSLKRNTFNLQDGTASEAVRALGIPDLSEIALTGANTNYFTASRHGGTVLHSSGAVPTGSTWSIASSSGVFLQADAYSISGTVYMPSDVVYLANGSTNSVVIENGGSVNLTAGTTLKISNNSAATGIKINTGGELVATGTSLNPITFTSSNDDSIGGDTTENGATTGTASDYYEAIDNEGGSVDADYVNMKYGSLEYYQNYGQANFEHTNTSSVNTALQVNNGDVIYRGSIHGATHGVYACNWVLSCTVDAAYVDWGSASGPYPSGGSLVCGKTSVNPWVYSSVNYSNHDVFATPACDSTQPPSAVLSAHVSDYQTEIAHLNTSCDASNHDACDYITVYNACIQDAWDIANSNASFALPSGSPISNPVGYYTAYLTAASDWIESTESSHVVGLVFGTGGDLLEEIATVSALNSGYDNCLSTAHSHGWY